MPQAPALRGPAAAAGAPLSAGDVRRHVAIIAQQGYTIVEGALSPELLGRLRRDIGHIKRVARAGGNGVIDAARKTETIFGETANFQSNLLTKSRTSWELATHPNLLRIVEGVVGHDCLASSFGFRHIGPGEKVQPLHTDDALYRYDVFERPFKKPLVCNSMAALDDFTAANGATCLVPGSHRWPEFPAARGAHADVVVHRAVMPAGSLAIWDGAIWHGSGANTSGMWRDAVNMNYCRGVVRQQENAMITTPRALVREMPPRLQALVGYTPAGGLGHSNVGPAARLLGAEEARALTAFWTEHDGAHRGEVARQQKEAYKRHRLRGRL